MIAWRDAARLKIGSIFAATCQNFILIASLQYQNLPIKKNVNEGKGRSLVHLRSINT